MKRFQVFLACSYLFILLANSQDLQNESTVILPPPPVLNQTTEPEIISGDPNGEPVWPAVSTDHQIEFSMSDIYELGDKIVFGGFEFGFRKYDENNPEITENNQDLIPVIYDFDVPDVEYEDPFKEVLPFTQVFSQEVVDQLEHRDVIQIYIRAYNAANIRGPWSAPFAARFNIGRTPPAPTGIRIFFDSGD